MRVTLLGHASVLVEMEGATVLMDPVFSDPFEDGAVSFCPARELLESELPAIDVVCVSHIHPDHFDLETLAGLSKSSVALCPDDPTLVGALQFLGFSDVVRLGPMERFAIGEGHLCTTPSDTSDVKEWGVVFSDSTGTFWNQVDTFPSTESVERICDAYKSVDLMFAKFASQNFEFFRTRTTRFPLSEHRRNLETVRRVSPRLAVPGSAGFRFRGDHEWLNPFLFPVSRERFVRDLGLVAPSVRTCLVNPGDVVDVSPGSVTRCASDSACVANVVDDTSRLRFDPSAPIPPLADPNESEYQLSDLRSQIDELLGEGLAGYLEHEGRVRPELEDYWQCCASYCASVVYPDGTVDHFVYGFRNDTIVFSRPDNPPDADVVHRIAASPLLDWVTARRTFFYVRGYSRRSSSLYALRLDADGVATERKSEPADLLWLYAQHLANTRRANRVPTNAIAE